MDSDPDIVMGVRLDMERPPTEIEISARRRGESGLRAETLEAPKKKHKKTRGKDEGLVMEDSREPDQEVEISQKKKKKRKRPATENVNFAQPDEVQSVELITHIPQDLLAKPKKRKRKHRADYELDHESPTEVAEIDPEIGPEIEIQESKPKKKRRHREDPIGDAVAED